MEGRERAFKSRGEEGRVEEWRKGEETARVEAG